MLRNFFGLKSFVAFEKRPSGRSHHLLRTTFTRTTTLQRILRSERVLHKYIGLLSPGDHITQNTEEQLDNYTRLELKMLLSSNHLGRFLCVAVGCPADWLNEGSTCIVFRSGSRTFKEAQDYCQVSNKFPSFRGYQKT